MEQYRVAFNNSARGNLSGSSLKEYVRHLKQLHNEGVVFLCGVFEEDGALQVLLANSKEEAEQYAVQESFVGHEVYQ